MQKETNVYDWIKTWMDTYVQGYKAPKTYKSYLNAASLMVRTHPELKEMRLDEMNEIYAQNLLKDLAPKYSYSQLNVIRVVFNQSFEKAASNGLIRQSPIHRLEIPKIAHKSKVVALTRVQEDAVLEVASKIYLGQVAVFMLETGLRRSELVNLKWEDFNRAREEIYVRKSKTEAGVRVVPLTRCALKILLLEPRTADSYIFHNQAGNPVNYTNLHRLYKRLRKETGISCITNHVYRHTFATRAVEDHMDVKALSMIIGHKSVAFTMQRYVHPDTAFLHDEMRAVEAYRKTHEMNKS